jgi:hypothetical protein
MTPGRVDAVHLYSPRAITLDLAKANGSVTARWFDPHEWTDPDDRRQSVQESPARIHRARQKHRRRVPLFQRGDDELSSRKSVQ